MSKVPAADEVGAETLERIADAPDFNRWMYDRLARWITGSVLEVGSGIGNMSRHFIDRESVTLTDTEQAYLDYLRAEYGDRNNVSVRHLMLPAIPPDLEGEVFDSIVCLNVLEHIQDDIGSLTAMRNLLSEQGRLVLLVPAFQWLFGELDVALGHHRRYTPAHIEGCFSQAGLRLIHTEYFNLAGMPGWWFTGKVLRKNLIPAGSMKLFNTLVPLFRLEKIIPFRVGQSVIAIGERHE